MKCVLIVEWNALYTTQLTQKAKKYHDGIIRLMQIGSHARQVRNWYLLLYLHPYNVNTERRNPQKIDMMKLLMLYWCPTVVSEDVIA